MTDDTRRVDQWLWAVRIYKTRSLASDACKGGHVTVNGRPAKPASPVRVGDRIEAYAAERERVLEVLRLINKRVSAPLAAECLVDHSPPPPPARRSCRRCSAANRAAGGRPRRTAAASTASATAERHNRGTADVDRPTIATCWTTPGP